MTSRASLTRRARTLGTLFTLSLLVTANRARAEDDDLSAAEHAYEEVDFAAVHRFAQRALEKGGAHVEELARLRVLLGISAAAQGDSDDAKQEFVIALAVQPSLRLDRALSPKIRGPYLEAQGYWGTHAERLLLRARADSERKHVALELIDPARIVDKITLRARALGTSTYTQLTLPATRSQRADLSDAQSRAGFEFAARATDKYGNTLYELGSDGDPVRALGPNDAGAASAPNAPATASAQPAARRSYLLPALLGAAGLGAAGAGVFFNVKRESSAREWNGPDCEAPGMTRAQQCGGVDASRRRSEELAIGFYAGAGVLLTSSVVVLLAGHADGEHRSAHASVQCGAGLPFSLACAGRF